MDSNPSILKRNLQDIPCRKSELNFQVDAGMSAVKRRGQFYIQRKKKSMKEIRVKEKKFFLTILLLNIYHELGKKKRKKKRN